MEEESSRRAPSRGRKKARTETVARPGRGKRTAFELTREAVESYVHSGSTYELPDGTKTPAKEILWDTKVPGLGLRLLPGGGRSWVLRYRVGNRRRLVALGRYGALTLDTARDVARIRFGELLKTDVDPLARKARGLTWAKFVPEILDEAKGRLKPTSLIALDYALRLASEDLARVPVAEITTERLEAAFHRWSRDRGKTNANKALAFVSSALKLAAKRGYRDKSLPNPAREIARHKLPRRGQDLLGEELERLGAALAAEEAAHEEARSSVQALRLIALTGARRREITLLRWEEVDLARGVLTLADSKTGARRIPLSTAAQDLLDRLDRGEPGEFVFPRAEKAIYRVWLRVAKAAGLPGLRIHDLRHHFVTAGIAANLSPALVGKVVGHGSAKTTARYIHLRDKPAQEAAETTSAPIAAALNGNPPAEVVKLPRRGA